MIIGLSYDLKQNIKLGQDCPDDALEEYDSPETVEGISQALSLLGHTVIKLGGGEEFIDNIRQIRPDIVFNIAEGLHSYRSREAQVPAILEMLDIPYVGSDPLCLAVSLDKVLTKKLAVAEGVPTPPWLLFNEYDEIDIAAWHSISFPAFIKPAYEGSSKGIRLSSKVDDIHQAKDLIYSLLTDYQQPVMLEQFIEGDEVTVGITGNTPPEVLGIMRVLPKNPAGSFIYSLEVKRDYENLVIYECPAILSPDQVSSIKKFSQKMFVVLGCRDFARIDFKMDNHGIPYFLEINPLAGLNPKNSDLCIMNRLLGRTYAELIEAILNTAIRRYSRCVRT